MNRRALIFVVCFCTAVAAQVEDQNAERSKLIALENGWNQAQIHRDGKALNRLLADTFVYTDWDGTVMNKADYIADAKNPAVKTSLVANEGVNVYFYPGAAVVTGAYHTKGTYKGKPFDHHGRFTDTWILSQGEWQCAASHTNLVQKAASQ